jgi:fumarate reductase flavoprotein subunit
VTGEGARAHVPIVVIGGGACGLVAALAARDAGAEVVVVERDARPSGSTALSSGFIPAAGTPWQRALAIEDSPERFADDVMRKNGHGGDPAVVDTVCREVSPTLQWLAARHGLRFVVVEGFRYPGHSALRMHAVPERTGAALMQALVQACERARIDILTSARVTSLHANPDASVQGVELVRPDGSGERIDCNAVVLACSGFGANRALVRAHLPGIADALYFGHPGNEGDALRFGIELGAAVADVTAWQGHASVATPHGILLTWALMMEGGIQVNAYGLRFADEHAGYSENAKHVLAQPGGHAWNVFDERLHALGMTFDDYRAADAAGAIRRAADVETLAQVTSMPVAALRETLEEVARYVSGEASDPLGRDFTTRPALRAPYRAARVTGALFHTQGGLVVDRAARVLRPDGRPLPNVFAGGGAARGISGAHDWGYLSGNGLLTAVVLGRIAGTSAAGLTV